MTYSVEVEELIDSASSIPTQIPLSWVFNMTDLSFLLEAIELSEDVVLDIESTGLQEHAWTGGPLNGGVAARVVLVSFTLPQRTDGEPTTWVLPLSHPESPLRGRWREILCTVLDTIIEFQKPVTGHNVKYDARYMYAITGRDISSLIKWDTRVSSHLLDENFTTRLKDRAMSTFGIDRWDSDIDLKTPGAAEKIPLFELGEYAGFDTYWTYRLAKNHKYRMFLEGIDYGSDAEFPESEDDFVEARLGNLAVWCAMPTTATLTAVEQRGLNVDLEWVHEEIRANQEPLDKLVAELSEKYPVDEYDVSFAPTSKWWRAWTQKAVDDGTLQVTAYTESGLPKWSKGVLLRQSRRGSDVATKILELRSHSKKLEYLNSWISELTRDNKIHTHYNVGSVATGRLSSSEPNIQQVTRSLKPAFVPSDGKLLIELDYSQIEMRVAAFISRCKPMLQAFDQGQDLHRMLAAVISGVDLSQVDSEMRQHAKAGNFGFLYAMGVPTFIDYAEVNYDVAFTFDKAQEVRDAFFDLWDGLSDWHQKFKNIAHQKGYVTSPIGRVRRVPGVYDSSEKMAAYAERQAINSPVQGFASDIMQMAAASIEGTLPNSKRLHGVDIVGTIHDSILVEVPEDRWEELGTEAISRMVNINDTLKHMDCYFDVPLAVEGKCGTRWGISDVGTLISGG